MPIVAVDFMGPSTFASGWWFNLLLLCPTPRELTTFKATWGEVIVFSNVTSGELAILQWIASHLCYKSSLYLTQ